MKTQLFFIFYLSVQSALFAQDEETKWLSWDRISLSINSTYYHNPWENYNNALKTVTHNLMIDDFFYEPRGSYDKIIGDVLFKAGIGYEISPNFTVSITGQYGIQQANFETYPDQSIPRDRGYPSYRQEMDFSINSYGIAFLYAKPVGQQISLIAGLGLDIYLSELLYKNAYYYWAYGPVGERFPHTRVKMQSTSLGLNATVGTEIKLIGRFSAQVSASYRYATFKNLKGTGKTHIENWGEIIYDAKLVDEHNYFGPQITKIKRNDAGGGWYALRMETFYTFPYYSEYSMLKAAKIDMRAFGIQIGIKMEL